MIRVMRFFHKIMSEESVLHWILNVLSIVSTCTRTLKPQVAHVYCELTTFWMLSNWHIHERRNRRWVQKFGSLEMAWYCRVSFCLLCQHLIWAPVEVCVAPTNCSKQLGPFYSCGRSEWNFRILAKPQAY